MSLDWLTNSSDRSSAGMPPSASNQNKWNCGSPLRFRLGRCLPSEASRVTPRERVSTGISSIATSRRAGMGTVSFGCLLEDKVNEYAKSTARICGKAAVEPCEDPHLPTDTGSRMSLGIYTAKTFLGRASHVLLQLVKNLNTRLRSFRDTDGNGTRMAMKVRRGVIHAQK
jgi:hypothetical protein